MLKYAVGLMMAVFSCGNASAYTYPGSPKCPWASGGSWLEYIRGDYGVQAIFSFHTNQALYSDVVANRCYTISHLGGGMFFSTGPNRAERDQRNKYEEYRRGVVENREFNVFGIVLSYNEAGEVYGVDGDLKGYLYCHVGTECWM